MFEIPFNFILIHPGIDILIVVSLSYFYLFRLYRNLLKSNPEKIMWMDLQATAIFLLLGYLNYSEKTIDFFGFEMEWWFYIVLAQFIVEGIFVYFHWKETKEYLAKMKKTQKEKELENLEANIANMKVIRKMMEDDRGKYRVQGNKVAMEKLESEIEKISVNIEELEENLREIQNKK